jgi:hypothetical protein
LIQSRSTQLRGRWGTRRLLGLVALAASGACGGPQDHGTKGVTCFRDDDCKPGLICVAPEGAKKRVCSDDPTPLISNVDGPPIAETGGTPPAVGGVAGGGMTPGGTSSMAGRGGGGRGGMATGGDSAGTDTGGTEGGAETGGTDTGGTGGGSSGSANAGGGTGGGNGGGGAGGTDPVGGTTP